MNECIFCGRPASVKYVVYSPVRVYLCCGLCALMRLGDEPARLWAVYEATGIQEAVSA